jgi:hypothetical protein
MRDWLDRTAKRADAENGKLCNPVKLMELRGRPLPAGNNRASLPEPPVHYADLKSARPAARWNRCFFGLNPPL